MIHEKHPESPGVFLWNGEIPVTVTVMDSDTVNRSMNPMNPSRGQLIQSWED